MTEPKRRPGRPATGKTPPLNVRVAQDVQDAARAKAEQFGRPFAAEVTRLLAEYAGRGEVWDHARQYAELRGETITAVIERKLAEYLSEPSTASARAEELRRDAERQRRRRDAARAARPHDDARAHDLPIGELIAAYKVGESLRTIGGRYGVSPKVIRTRLLDIGIQTRPRGHNGKQDP